MHADLFRTPLRLQFASPVLKIATSSFFFGCPPKSPAALLPSTDLVADVFKLSLPVWVRCSLDGLAVGLKAVVFRLQQLRHKRVTHLVVQPLEFLDQFAN